MSVVHERGPRRTRSSLLKIAAGLLSAGFVCALLGAHTLPESATQVQRRRLEFSAVGSVLGSHECKTEYDTNFAVVIYFALILYTFIGLAIVCDEYFCESLEKISTALSLSDDVAGATFMAAGSSAPELFTAIVTIFVEPGEQGVGTIVGSAVFNICVIVGVTTLCAGQVLQLWWFPLMRDSSVYALSILLMMWAMKDGQVTALEGGVLTATYFLYVLVMMFNGKIVDFLTEREKRKALEQHQQGLDVLELSPNPFKKFTGINPTMQPAFRTAGANQKTVAKRRVQREQVQQMLMTAITVNRVKNKFVSRLSSRSSRSSAAEVEEEEEESGPMGKCLTVVSWPLATLMRFSIPDCREEAWSRFYAVTFFMSIMWIGLLSFIMVDLASRAGCILGVPEFLMGLTVLAAGTSVPDALSSVLVARNGQGNMAVCNVLGSNVFNILLGLGLPWLIAALTSGAPYPTGEFHFEPMIILFGYLIAFIVILIVFDWKLTPRLGYVLLVMQVAYWTWNVGKVYYLEPMNMLGYHERQPVVEGVQ